MRLFLSAMLLAAGLSAQPVVFDGAQYEQTRCDGPFVAAFSERSSRVALFDAKGGTLYETEARTSADGAYVVLNDVAAMDDGKLVAAGSWSATNHGFVVLESAGAPVRAVDTYPFLPRRMTIGPHDHVWLHDGRKLRKYSIEGELRAEAEAEAPGGLAYFGASNSHVGLWILQERRWLQFNPDGSFAGELPLDLPEECVAGIALTDAGDIYGGTTEALKLYDRQQRRWERARLPDGPRIAAGLIGADGPRLVFRVSDAGPLRLLRVPH